MAPSSPRTRHPFSPWGEGARRADEGAFLLRSKVPPRQCGRMTYGRIVKAYERGDVAACGRKSWPHVLSPEGRGNGERIRFGKSEGGGEVKKLRGVRHT